MADIKPKLRFLVALLACALSANVTCGETPPKDPPKETLQPIPPIEPGKLMVRERTVYVPYDKLSETFEKEGRGVFLPYNEFLKLWNAAQPKDPPKDDPKPPAEAVITGGSYVGTAKENVARFEVTYKVKALNKNWSEAALPLKNVALESVTISDPAAVFTAKGDGYALMMPKPGEYTITLAFAVRVTSTPGTRSIEFGIPQTAVSRLELTIPEKDLRVDVNPKMAATLTTPENNSTKLLAFVGNSASVAIKWMPPVDRVEKGEALVIATQFMHVELGERILRVENAINYKIERNEEDTFRIKTPQDMRLLFVKGNNIREWTVENGVLIVRLHSPVKDQYGLLLRFERILEKTPDKLGVPFPQTVGALREDGFVTVANEQGLRVRVETSTGLSQIDPKELPESMRRAELLAGFRYLAHPLALSLSIELVKPQIQSSVRSVISLGVDDDTLNGWVEYNISKVGIFQMKLRYPSRWEVVTLGDKTTVEDTVPAADGDFKILTVNLKNKVIGQFRLPFKFSGPGRAAPGELTLEPIQVLDTQQDKGTFGISAPKAFKLTTIDKKLAVPANVQELFAAGLAAQLPQDHELPLAYSYNQTASTVKILIERRKTEIRTNAFHVVTVKEAGLELAHSLKYFIEFADVDKLVFSAPKELDDKLHIVVQNLKEKKITGVKEGRSIWEITLQEKVRNTVIVRIDHEQDLKNLEQEKPLDVVIPEVRAEDVNSQQGFIAVRKDSVLEIDAKTTNLEPLESVNLPAEMHLSNVYLAYRYFQPDHSLSLKLTRHNPVLLTNTVVDLMRVTAVLSEERKLFVRSELFVENAGGEQYLKLDLGKDAVIRSAAVNRAPVNPLKHKDGSTLVKLATSRGPMPVELIYTVPVDDPNTKMGWMGSVTLSTLKVLQNVNDQAAVKPTVPVNKIELDLFLPEEYTYMNFGGDLHLRQGDDRISNTLAWIRGGLPGGSRKVAVVHNGSRQFPESTPLLGEFRTQGRRMHFDTLAPEGTLHFTYVDRKLFWVLDLIVVIAALAVGFSLARRRKITLSTTILAFLILPLCICWFLTSDAAEPFAAWLVAGVFLVLAMVLGRIRESYVLWRNARIAMAPDPFLEDASEPIKPVEPAASAPSDPPASEEKKPDEKQ